MTTMANRFRGQLGTGNAERRARWVEARLLELKPGTRLLDAGAGQSQYRRFCNHLQYVSQDFCEYEGTGNREGLQTGTWDTSAIDIVSDIASIPEPDQSFDAILCTEVLEHVPDPIAALREFRRLLKKDGTLLLSAPFCSLTHYAPYHYYTGFNKYFYQYHLEKMNFEILSIEENGDYFDLIGQELLRLQSMGGKSSILVKGLIAVIMRIILVTRKRAHHERDLGCFGYHVKARKRDHI